MSRLRIIKKYPNRRLYDTEISSYVTLEDIRQLVQDGESFEVQDAKTQQDLTRSVLLQIITEREEQGQPLLTTNMLSQLIRFYGDSLQGFMGNYLERSMQVFLERGANIDHVSRIGEQAIALAARTSNLRGRMLAPYVRRTIAASPSTTTTRWPARWACRAGAPSAWCAAWHQRRSLWSWRTSSRTNCCTTATALGRRVTRASSKPRPWPLS